MYAFWFLPKNYLLWSEHEFFEKKKINLPFFDPNLTLTLISLKNFFSTSVCCIKKKNTSSSTSTQFLQKKISLPFFDPNRNFKRLFSIFLHFRVFFSNLTITDLKNSLKTRARIKITEFSIFDRNQCFKRWFLTYFVLQRLSFHFWL